MFHHRGEENVLLFAVVHGIHEIPHERHEVTELHPFVGIATHHARRPCFERGERPFDEPVLRREDLDWIHLVTTFLLSSFAPPKMQDACHGARS